MEVETLGMVGAECELDAHSSASADVRPHFRFQPVALWVPPSCAHSVVLLSLLHGCRSLFVSSDPLPMDPFAAPGGVALDVPPIGPAEAGLRLVVLNPHGTPRTFRAIVFGHAVKQTSLEGRRNALAARLRGLELAGLDHVGEALAKALEQQGGAEREPYELV